MTFGPGIPRYHAATCFSPSVMHLLLVITSIIGPHRSTTYVDAAYCYRPSSVICRSVCRLLSVTVLSPAKTAEPIEIPFWLWTLMGPGNSVLHEVQIPMGNGNFWG